MMNKFKTIVLSNCFFVIHKLLEIRNNLWNQIVILFVKLITASKNYPLHQHFAKVECLTFFSGNLQTMQISSFRSCQEESHA